MPEVAEVSRYQFSIAYAGEGEGDDHAILVDVLAPALLALGKLMNAANAELNGKKASAHVNVVTDFEAKCFNVNFELVVGLYDKIRSFLRLEDVKEAKNVFEWVGLLGGGAATYMGYLKWKRGRKTVSAEVVPGEDGENYVSVRIEGENNSVTIHQNIYNLSRNPKALRATRDAFLPVGQEGFDRVEVRDDKGNVSTIEPAQIESIIASCSSLMGEVDVSEPEINIVPAWLSVYSPVYDEKAHNWRFRLGTEVVYVDISETSIAHDALERGGALNDDTYQVKLEITIAVDDRGTRSKPKYKVLEVLKFVPAEPPLRQTDFLDEIPDAEIEDEPEGGETA